jgi:hypothetical protein
MGVERAATELLLRVARLVGRLARLDDFAIDLEELYLTRRERNRALAMGWLLGQLIRSPLAFRLRAATPRRRSIGNLLHWAAAGGWTRLTRCEVSVDRRGIPQPSWLF